MPDLIEIQKNSFDKFVHEELKDIIKDFSPIDDFSQNMRLEFLDCYLENKTKYTIEECKERDTTYAAPMKVRVRLTVKGEDGAVRDIAEQEVFMGDFPLMTPTGTFIINGAERVIASQLVRSPGGVHACAAAAARQRDRAPRRLRGQRILRLRCARGHEV